jgi:hypothetical protein
MLNFLALLPEFIISANVESMLRKFELCATSTTLLEKKNFYSYSLREFLVRAEENVSTTKLHSTAARTSVNYLLKFLFETKLLNLIDLLK